MSVVWMTTGGVTDSRARFATKVDTGPVRIAYDTDPGMGAPAFSATEAVDAQGVAKVEVSGLDPDTRYFWQVEDNSVLDTSVTGQVLTDPPVGLPGNFVIAAGSCAGLNTSFPGSGSELAPDRISNHPVFDTIRQLASLRRFCHLGDDLYYDLGSGAHGIVGGASLANYRTARDDLYTQPRQAHLYRDVATTRQADDHDRAFNNHDSTFTDALRYNTVYRETEPAYDLPDGASNGGTYFPFQLGRVLFIASDVRTFRSPNNDPDGPSKTMLGADQKAWMDGLLAASDAEMLVWLMPSQWLSSGLDTWASFATERDDVVEMFGDHGFLGRMSMLYGDRHAAGIDSGANNQWGNFPILMAASLDASTGAADTADFDILPDTPGRQQYGTVEVTDTGSAIAVRLSAWRGTDLLGSHQFGIILSTPNVVGSASVREFAPVVAGSHDPVFEARVLTSFQSGEDPPGEALPIIDGDVQFDATAEVFATLSLTTRGTDPTTGRSWFPRLADDLLAPYGNEVFVRRGVDTGSAVLWSPLGIFRIETAEQPGDVEDPISLSGSDRMAGLIEADVIEPREFGADTGVAAFFASLIGDVYPDALVVFDDDAGFADVGRRIVVDESRYEPLQEVVDGLGKVMFWDGQGRLRIAASPDEGDPVWTIAAGRNGVLIEAGRRVTRVGAPNGVMVIGEGGGGQEPVTGVAIDQGPKSPTRWGGRYGKVLAREQLPTVTTVAQAEEAARQLLRRRLGAPHSADFGAVVNPGLRPRMPVLVVQRDGNRDRHVVQTLTIPLRVGPHMTGTTRERTNIVIGNVIA